MKDERQRADEGRRRLLQMGAYSAPAVLSVVVVQNAGPQPSCNPIAMGKPPDMMPNMMPNMMPGTVPPGTPPGQGTTGTGTGTGTP